MNWFKVKIELKSPTGTPWQADTIFGHLCWIVAHRDGEGRLKQFLQPFLDGNPTFLLSDGFPTSFLPRPLTFKLPDDGTEEQFNKNRKIRKLSLLSESEFEGVINGVVIEPIDHSTELKEKSVVRSVLKNQLSRLTGTTSDDGNLYGFIEHWMPEVVIYGKVNGNSQEFLEKLFDDFKHFGYGKRKAVGYGAIKNINFDDQFKGFNTPDDANGFVSLSAFTPLATDPTEGRWRIRVKYGRLGEEFASGDNPFKKPIVMLTAGSVFYDNPIEEYYGRMITDVSLVPGVVHYAYALPVPIKISEKT
jgi:CRISPR-associated protein Csm4